MFFCSNLGWASSEFLTTKLIPLWVGARAIEFNWIHTQLSFDTNISLVSLFCCVLQNLRSSGIYKDIIFILENIRTLI